MVNINIRLYIFLLFYVLLIILIPVKTAEDEFRIFRVMLDPGHGGYAMPPVVKHGDRYDVLSGRYLAYFGQGARYKNYSEHEIVYSIAEKVKKILELTKNGRDFGKFIRILSRYSEDTEFERIIIIAGLSRPESGNIRPDTEKDINAEYRLFDYPGNNEMLPGRISRINAFRPHLAVSLHCDLFPPAYYRGMNPVIVPPFRIFKQGMEYLQGIRQDRKFFFNSKYSDWFTETVKRSGFQWFLNDTSVYFTGYPLDKQGKINLNRFQGYRHNMVNWHYKEDQGWHVEAGKHRPGSHYSIDINDFSAESRFFEREKSVYEQYRRDNGEEGFGGDNMYASCEIIRYILSSLSNAGIQHPSLKLSNPYISTWSVPLLINAVAVYIELGYLKLHKHRYIMTEKQDEIAEGIAAGIYSLFAGINIRESRFKYFPKGKKLDIDKYVLPSGESYFNIVTQPR